jgi:hypothetical protein
MGEVGRGASVAETESEAGGPHRPVIASELTLLAMTLFFLRHPEPLKGAKDLVRLALPVRLDTRARDPSVVSLPQDDAFISSSS